MKRCVAYARWTSLWSRWILALGLACGCMAGLRASSASPGFFLEIQAANPAGGGAQLFYDTGQWYSHHDSVRVELPPSTKLQPHRFALPAEPVRRLRLDPMDGAGRLQIGTLRLLTADGRVLEEFGPECLAPMGSIKRLTVAGGVASIETEAGDPMLLVAHSVQRSMVNALGRRTVGPTSLFLLTAAYVVLGALALGAALRPLLRKSASKGRGRHAAPLAFMLGGVFLLVAGARLHWLKLYSRPMPFWDDWKAGVIDMILPFRGGYLDWQALFLPQAEHRVLLTRLVTLTGGLLNGEWDPRVSMALSAFLFAGTIALLCGLLARTGSRWGVVLACGLAGWSCLPFDPTNIFWANQSPMYALNLAAVVLLCIATDGQPTRITWLGAIAAGLLSIFTMGAGFVAPLVAGGLCLLAAWKPTPPDEEAAAPSRRLVILALLLFAIGGFGLSLHRESSMLTDDYARTWARLAPTLLARTSWPLSPHVGYTLIVWLPWVALSCQLLVAKGSTPLARAAFGLGAWALIGLVGLAYSRPNDPAPFESRYYTLMSAAVLAATLATAALAQTRSRRIGLIGLCVLALAVSTTAMVKIGLDNRALAQATLTSRSAYDNVVRPFLATGDPKPLQRAPFEILPYWNGAELADLLDAPALQDWLPAVLRSTLAQRPGSTLSPQQTPGPLTVAARELMKAGLVLAAAGIVLMALSVVRTWRRT